MDSGSNIPDLALIRDRLQEVQARVSASAGAVDRDPAQIRLLAVTKGFPPSVVRAAHEIGLRDFGENRVQEGLQKMAQLRDLDRVSWHMIGHIQSRKAADVAPNFASVHSVGRTKIAERLNRYREGPPLPILLQCNVSGERSKHGWELADESTWPAVLTEFAEVSDFPNLEIRGLMTIAPWTSDEKVVRGTFKRLRRLAEFLRQELHGITWDELSMGMSDDYQLAVEEGATVLRLGRAIFGERE